MTIRMTKADYKNDMLRDLDNDHYMDISFYSKQGEYLEDMFTLQDFLREPTTRMILENHHEKQFYSILKPNIQNFHNEIMDVVKFNSRLLSKDTRNLFIEDVIYLISKHINKKYDLTIFYENPSLASKLLEKIVKK